MNPRRLWAILRKEFIHITRDTRTVVIVFIMPLMQMILLGYTVLSDIKNIPIAICDLSYTTASRDFAAAFRATDVFKVNYNPSGEREVIRLLEEGKIQLGVIIPPDYAETLARGERAEVAFYLDGTNAAVAQTAMSSAELIAQSESVKVLQKSLGAGGAIAEGGVFVRSRVWYNPNLAQANFTIPAMVGLVMQSFMTQLVVGAIVREREKGTMEQLIATPLSGVELIVGKVVPYIGLAALTAVEILAMGLLWFRVPVNGGISLLVLYSLLFLAAMLGWAVLISALARTDQEARMMNLFMMLPSIFLSGMFYPRTSMPRILQIVSETVPLTHFLVMIRAVVLKGVGVNMVIPQIAGLIVFGVASMWLAARSFKHKLT
jgi:ABC-2 type transport system permease protein